MATERTRLTELGTAVGIQWSAHDLARIDLERARIPGLRDADWKPVVLTAWRSSPTTPVHQRLRRALANGHAFRAAVLRGTQPHRIEWIGGERNVWTSDVPGDLGVNDVYFVQAKYDGSRCLLNTAPAALFDDLLVQDGSRNRPSWFLDVAPEPYQRFYDAVRAEIGSGSLPADVAALGPADRVAIKTATGRRQPRTPAEARAYRNLCEAVSEATAARWRRRLDGATAAQRTQMLFRLLRIAGGPYWLLGDGPTGPVRVRVSDTRAWRRRFELRSFHVEPAGAGQPQVDWSAVVRDRGEPADGGSAGAGPAVERTVRGFCEIRWSHGKLQGNPECKVQLVTPIEQLPGYGPMAGSSGQLQLDVAG